MNRAVLPSLLFLAIAALVAWFIVFRDDPLPAAWQALRFRDPAATQDQARQLRAEMERLHDERLKEGFTSDTSQEVRDELNLWSDQFHLGEADRMERLGLQHLTKADMRQRIQEALQDEAFIESRIAPVTEQAAREWYDAHSEELRIPALHRVSHIFLSRHVPKKPDRSAEMLDIQRQLQKGAAFAMAAARHSEDARSKAHGGDLGWLSAARMPGDFMSPVEKLRIGEVSGSVETRLGWHLLLVTERHPARLPTFEETREEILALLDFEQRARLKP